MNLKIGDLIDVPPVETVIRLDEALSRSQAITSTFVCTSDVGNHLDVLAASFSRETGNGIFLEGDFGSGKSHFLAVVAAWLDDRPGADALSSRVSSLAAYKASARRLLPVEISLVRYRAATPLERIITSAIESALARHGAVVALSPLSRFRERLREILVDPGRLAAFTKATGIDAGGINAWFSEHPGDALATSMAFLSAQGVESPYALIDERDKTFEAAFRAVREASFDGMALIIDELSEFFRSKPDAASLNEDARTLQLLGELSATHPVWIIAAVQESIERTGDIASATFRKIKDRFPVRFKLSTLHIRDLIAKRLVRHRDGAGEKLLAVYDELRKNFPRLNCSAEQFIATYPLHPETLSLLEGLGELFSQHRGIVDFVHARIAGDPSRGILGVLDRPAGELLAPDSIYEHFSQRLAEISAFQAYPRHIVPHLDEVIGRVIDGEEDLALARRLVRMLVPYAIHPTAQAPSARKLAELAGVMIAPHDPDANAEFVAKSILDPLAGSSRFLSKRESASGVLLDAQYVLSASENHAGNLRMRIDKAMADCKRDDSRLVLDPLAELPAGISWPGAEILRGCVERTILWRQTQRTASVAFAPAGSEPQLAASISSAIDNGDADFAVVIIAGNGTFSCNHTAVWRFGVAGQDLDTLAEYFAARSVARDLHASNPAHTPLIPLANDAVRRLEPAARAAVLNALFGGSFDGGAIVVDPSAIQVRRFDRLLEAAGELLLEERFPKFKDIAPRLLQQSIRLYQRLLDEFVAPGSISMSEARAKSLTEAIEALASPLGIVEVKSGSYRLAPAMDDQPFLVYVMSMIRPAGQTRITDLFHGLRIGPYGVPRECACFLFAALAQSGIVSLLRSGRAVPLDFLSMTAVESADAIVPGEIISQADRETLTSHCPFLAPQGGWPSFGLRQQREAWQTLVRLKPQFESVLSDNAKRLSASEEFSAFATFDFGSLRETSRLLGEVFSQVKVSHQAREGLERFLSAWRSSGLSSAQLEQVRSVNRFFSRFAEKFIFIAHYVRHRSVEEAAKIHEQIAQCREPVLAMLKDPLHLVVPDEGVQLGAAFDVFREAYAALYQREHALHYEALLPPKVSKSESRLVALFELLGAIEQLDRPPGLDGLLREIRGDGRHRCNRPVVEELLRSPTCGCEFQMGSERSSISKKDFTFAIEQAFSAYRSILSSPQVIEAVKARAFGIRDMDADAAGRLGKLCAVLQERPATSSLVDLLDERTVAEIGRALSGTITLQQRSLGKLAADLSGRRLTPAKVHGIIDSWLASPDANTLVSIDGGAVAADTALQRPTWWAQLHPELSAGGSNGPAADDSRRLEAELEELYPAREMSRRLMHFTDEQLAGFVSGERFHTGAICAAWELLVKRIVQRPGAVPAENLRSHHCNSDQAASIDNRLNLLTSLAQCNSLPFPDRLRQRLFAAGLWADNWSTADMRKSLAAIVASLESLAADWLAVLPPVSALDTTDRPFVIVLDAVPPDLWLEVSQQFRDALANTTISWARLACGPHTVPSLCALFGIDSARDPLDEFPARGISYHSVKGDESTPLIDLLPPFSAEVTVVVRVTIIDASAHNASLPLPSMTGTLSTVLSRHLPGVIKACAEHKRRLVLTADHGLSWAKGTLFHGKGGVFEEAVVRVEWKKV
jgi:hypothetical protein